jgi:hypothetical protein
MYGMKYVLCIDVGYNHLGLAVFSRHARKPVVGKSYHFDVEGKKMKTVAERDALVVARQVAILNSYAEKFNIKLCVAELPSGGAKGARALSQMRFASGVVQTWAKVRRIKLLHVMPIDVKAWADVATRKVAKNDVMSAVELKYPGFLPSLKKDAEHVADALAAYLFLHDTGVIEIYVKDTVE